jgi:hypothetical protein
LLIVHLLTKLTKHMVVVGRGTKAKVSIQQLVTRTHSKFIPTNEFLQNEFLQNPTKQNPTK